MIDFLEAAQLFKFFSAVILLCASAASRGHDSGLAYPSTRTLGGTARRVRER